MLFDSGVRSGTDVVKALALGATAVGIGRPFLYGLALAGAAGAEHVLTLDLAGHGRFTVLTGIGGQGWVEAAKVRLATGLILMPHGAQKLFGWFGGYGGVFAEATMHTPVDVTARRSAPGYGLRTCYVSRKLEYGEGRITSAAGIPSDGLRPIACNVSETQPGETALTRTASDGSAAAARTNASTAALTVVMIALPGEGNCAARPVVSVIAPPDRTVFTP